MNMGFKEHKEKQWVRLKGSAAIPKNLSGLAKQVENKKFGDTQFEKAYNKFKAPAYGMKGE
jgi:hypothetical protein